MHQCGHMRWTCNTACHPPNMTIHTLHSPAALQLGAGCLADIEAAAQRLAASSADPADANSAQVLVPLFQACSTGS